MKLKKLIKDIPNIILKGNRDLEITGISTHSSYVVPGNLFIVHKGERFDGSQFISEAILGGASCILTDMYNPFHKDIVQIIHPSPLSIESLLARRFYDNPSKQLFLIGITGTNGKTTTAYLVRYLFNALGINCGLMGTIEHIIGMRHKTASFTTSDVITNNKLLREMCNSGAKAAVMEVTSHGLLQRRVDNIAFDVAVFTNLSQDHLDYHGSLESYFAAKNVLFDTLGSYGKKTFAIVNSDSTWSDKLSISKSVRMITYGIESRAMLRAEDVELDEDSITFTACFLNQKVKIDASLVGRFNVYNILAACAVGLSYGFSLESMARVLSSFKAVPGRLERVVNPLGRHVYVDFAHTSDALHNVLSFLREISKGRLITVFGCGGDRDKGKRPLMGEVAQNLSDICVITSDNPRSEDPMSIISDILASMKPSSNLYVEVDRKKAIEKAIGLMEADDMVLIAGKGHEKQQIFMHQSIPFDDVEVASCCLKNLASASITP